MPAEFTGTTGASYPYRSCFVFGSASPRTLLVSFNTAIVLFSTLFRCRYCRLRGFRYVVRRRRLAEHLFCIDFSFESSALVDKDTLDAAARQGLCMEFTLYQYRRLVSDRVLGRGKLLFSRLCREGKITATLPVYTCLLNKIAIMVCSC